MKKEYASVQQCRIIETKNDILALVNQRNRISKKIAKRRSELRQLTKNQ